MGSGRMACLWLALCALLLLGCTARYVSKSGQMRSYKGRLLSQRLHETVSGDIASMKASSIAGGNSQFVESLSLTQWGVFREASITLGARPSFTVISGESGAGKSVFISAIEYLSGSSTFKGKRPLHRTAAASDSVITLRTGGALYRRCYSPLTKRSFSEADGQRVPMKHISDALSRTVRVWSANSLQLLDNGNAGVISYVDRMLASQDRILSESVGTIHAEWRTSYENLQRLQAIEKRMIKGNEMELLSHFSSEIAQFEVKLRKLLLEILQITEDLAVTFSRSSPEEDVEDGGAAVAPQSPLSVRELLAGLYSLKGLGLGGHGKKTREEVGVTLDLTQAWRIVQSAEKLYSGLSKAFALDGGGRTPPINGAPGGPAGVIKKSIEDLEDAFEKLSDTQIYIKKIGFDETSINSQLENAQLEIQGALKLLLAGSKTLSDLDESLPTLDPLLGRLYTIRSEWEGLSRKHDVTPPDLHLLRGRWNGDLSSMQNIVSELPAAMADVDYGRVAYFKAARALTQSRRAAAEKLSRQVNDLFPSLEMASKRVRIEVVVNADVEELMRSFDASVARTNDALRPVGGECGDNGWDSVYMTVYPHATSVSSAEERDSVSSSALTLSSGEAARLSLSLETCVLTNDDEIAVMNGDNKGDGVQLIIFDEVDAHVGGETAAVIARLLHALGQRRQVIAVSHNPIFAAAADKHFVVSREPTGNEGGGTNEFGSSNSRVLEVTGDERELEIMRMAGPLLSIISKFKSKK